MKSKILSPLVLLSSLLCGETASAYTKNVHAALTYEAASVSILSQDEFWEGLGYNSPSSRLFPNTPFPGGSDDPATNEGIYKPERRDLTPIQLLQYGSYAEDAKFGVIGSRSFRHFINPQQATMQNGVLDAPGLFNHFRSSPNWILEDLGDIENTGSIPEIQSFSYKDAIDYYHLGLISSNKLIRETYMGQALQAIGHVVHHIQDMAQPQHTRNEPHCDIEICKFLDLPFEGNLLGSHSTFESYTNIQWKCGRIGSEEPVEKPGENDECAQGNINLTTYHKVNLPTARDYWLNINQTGLADFSSRLFVTKLRNFQIDRVQPDTAPITLGEILPAGPDLPLPDNTTLTLNPIQAGQLFQDAQVTGEVLYLSGLASDRLTNTSVNIDKLTRLSIFDVWKFRRQRQIPSSRFGLFAVDETVFESRYEALLPRAVGYSAGLIDHFFRAKLDITELPTGNGTPSQWRVTNRSGVPINGQLQFYYDTSLGARYSVGATSGVNLAINSSATLPGFAYPNNSTGKFIVVFRGSVGAEIDGVGGKVFNYSEPVAPICTPIYQRNFSSDTGSPKQISFTINEQDRAQNFYGVVSGVGECKKIPFFNPFCSDSSESCSIVVWEQHRCPKAEWELTKGSTVVASGSTQTAGGISLTTGSYKLTVSMEETYDSPWEWGACLSACSQNETGSPCYVNTAPKNYTVEYTASNFGPGDLVCQTPLEIGGREVGSIGSDYKVTGSVLLSRGNVYAVNGACACWPRFGFPNGCDNYKESLTIKDPITGEVVYSNFPPIGPLDKPFYIP